MRVWSIAVAVLVAGGSGCSSSGKPTSFGTTGVPPGDEGDAAMAAPDLGAPGPDLGTTGGGDMTMSGPDMANPAGPWPVADVTWYGSAQGLGAILDANPDDAQDIWAASNDTLYLLRPGDTTFAKFTAADGLHVGPFTDAYGNPNMTYITAIAGGAPGQVYVGYYGYESLGDPYKDTEAQKELGNGDDVHVDAANKLTITRLLFRCDAERGNGCWEDRSVRRLLYTHTGIAAGHSWWGFNHGVTHMVGDDFGDHVHPEVWYPPPPGGTYGSEALGEFYGLAVDAQGNLWMAGRYAVGLQTWNPKPNGGPLSDTNTNDQWVSGPMIYAFTTDTADHSLGYPTGPWVPDKYRENNRGAAVSPDGRLWLARDGGGLVSWDPKSGSYNTIQRWAQAPSDLMDVQADPDGTIWLVTSGGALMRLDPATGAISTFAGASGVTRIYMDTTVVPRALYASTSGGLAVIRAK